MWKRRFERRKNFKLLKKNRECLESSQATLCYAIAMFQVTLWAHEFRIWLFEDVKTKGERGGGNTTSAVLSLGVCRRKEMIAGAPPTEPQPLGGHEDQDQAGLSSLSQNGLPSLMGLSSFIPAAGGGKESWQLLGSGAPKTRGLPSPDTCPAWNDLPTLSGTLGRAQILLPSSMYPESLVPSPHRELRKEEGRVEKQDLVGG